MLRNVKWSYKYCDAATEKEEENNDEETCHESVNESKKCIVLLAF